MTVAATFRELPHDFTRHTQCRAVMDSYFALYLFFPLKMEWSLCLRARFIKALLSKLIWMECRGCLGDTLRLKPAIVTHLSCHKRCRLCIWRNERVIHCGLWWRGWIIKEKIKEKSSNFAVPCCVLLLNTEDYTCKPKTHNRMLQFII